MKTDLVSPLDDQHLDLLVCDIFGHGKRFSSTIGATFRLDGDLTLFASMLTFQKVAILIGFEGIEIADVLKAGQKDIEKAGTEVELCFSSHIPFQPPLSDGLERRFGRLDSRKARTTPSEAKEGGG